MQHSVIIANFMGSLVSNNELVRKKEEDCGLLLTSTKHKALPEKMNIPIGVVLPAVKLSRESLGVL